MSDVSCRFLTDDRACMIGSCLANRRVEPWDGVCETCNQSSKPQAINYVTASIAHSIWRNVGDYQKSDDILRRQAAKNWYGIGIPEAEEATRKPDLEQAANGIGTILHQIATRIGFSILPECRCWFWIKQMNSGGESWTLRNIADIKEAMMSEFYRRHPDSWIPYWVSSAATTLLIWFAISRHRKRMAANEI